MSFKWSIIFIILFSYSTYYSQSGSLCLEVGDDTYYEFDLYRDTVLIKEKVVDFYEVCFDSLPEGEYNVKIYRDGYFVMHRFKLEVKRSKKNTYSIDFYEPYEKELADTIIDEIFTTTVNYLSSLNNPEFSSLINREFRIAVLQGESFIVNKNIEVGIKGGGELSLTDFKNDTSLVGLTGVKRERYFDWNLAIEPTIRFSTNNRRSYETKGLFLELGACYHFPLVFRYVYSLNQYKYTQSRIHNFNNLEGGVRLGYQEFSLMASYRFFDVVKGSLPQLPKLNVGLSLVITQ